MTLKITTQSFLIKLALAVVCLGLQRAGGQVEAPPLNQKDAAPAAASGKHLTSQDLPELRCRLQTNAPVLDFEFRFVAPFRVDIPFRRLLGGGRRLSITSLVRPVSIENAEPVRSHDTYVLPKEVPENTRGDLELSGSFALGEGVYEMDWELQDQAGRSCRVNWKVQAKLSRRDRDVNMTLKPGAVARSGVYLFRSEPVAESSAPGLRVKLLMNLDVPSRRRARIELRRYVPMVSGLRMMSRHPALTAFDVVAFSVEEQRVLHQSGFSRPIRFPALGRAIRSLSPATVDLRNLREGSSVEFLDQLLANELSDTEGVDAVIFLGADDRFGKRVSPATIERFREKRIPVFHFNPAPFLWRGVIGNLVKALDGKEYRVQRPHELATAVEKLVAEISDRRPLPLSGAEARLAAPARGHGFNGAIARPVLTSLASSTIIQDGSQPPGAFAPHRAASIGQAPGYPNPSENFATIARRWSILPRFPAR